MSSFSKIVLVALCAAAVLSALFAEANPLFSNLKKEQAIKRAKSLYGIRRQRLVLPFKNNKNPAATEPQPKAQVIMITNNCTQEMFLDEEASFLESGAFDVAPSANIGPHMDSQTFVTVPFIGSDHINGTTTYWGDAFVVWTSFGEVKGEWFMEIEYATKDDCALIGSVPVGKKAFYNIIVGKGVEC